MKKLLNAHEDALVSVLTRVGKIFAGLEGEPELKTALSETSTALFYAYLLRRSLRRGLPSLAKLRTGETFTKQEISALAGIVYYIPYFVVQSGVIAHRRSEELQDALESYQAKQAVKRAQQKEDAEAMLASVLGGAMFGGSKAASMHNDTP